MNILQSELFSVSNVLLTIDMDDRLKIASLNTLLGISTVFVILILIIFLIKLFKFLPLLQDLLIRNKKSRQNKMTNEDLEENILTQITKSETSEDLSDDLELVAVITAAIYASFENDFVISDGFVVRSIRKVKSGR